MNNRKSRFTSLWLVCFVMLGSLGFSAMPSYAQVAAPAAIIQSIDVQGNQRIEDSTVLSYLSVRAGDPFDPDRINDAIKALFKTGLFSDVVIGRQGGVLIVQVKENLIVNKIAFEGNDKFKDDALETEISLKPRHVYTVTKVQNDVERLLQVYQRSGRFGVKVEPKVIKLERNRVNLVFEIAEGKKTKVEAINFVGNRRYSDRKLKDVILTKESAFWRFLTATDTYDPDRLAVDEDVLRQFYLKRGYADFRVLSSVGELLPSKDAFIVTFTIEEGAVYKFGKIEIDSSISKLNSAAVKNELKVKTGERYDASKLETSILDLKDKTSDLGFAFVDITPDINKDDRNRRINIKFKIAEGKKVFVERIDIKGNSRTQDNVIRREFRLIEGDAFSLTKLRDSKKAIEGLAYFSVATVDNKPGSADDKTVIDVELEEQSTGSFTIGAGFSSSDGPLGTIEVSENNLLGKGYAISAKVDVSTNSRKGRVSFTNPYFQDKPVSAGFDLFYDDTEFEESNYTQLDIGGTVRFGYKLSKNWSQRWSYTWKRSEIENITSLSGLFSDEPGVVDRSILTHQLVFSDYDSFTKPTDGESFRISTAYAGVGGNVNYIKNVAKLTVLRPTPIEDWTVKLVAEAGLLSSFDDEGTLISDRFFLGSSQVRGFKSSGIGPRVTSSGSSAGGTKYYTASAELRFPLPKILGLELKGRAFVDAGSLWDPESDYITVAFDDDESVRIGAGVGFTWTSPIGPLAFDFGFPLTQESYDKDQVLRFSAGTRF